MTSAEVAGELAVGDEVVVQVGPVAHGGSLRGAPRGAGGLRPARPPGGTGAGRASPRPRRASGSCGATPSRFSPRARTASRRRARMPGRDCAVAATSSTPALPDQRELKAAVVREQFARLAGIDVDVDVEPVPGDTDGLGWRTRVEFAVDRRRRAGPARGTVPTTCSPSRTASSPTTGCGPQACWAAAGRASGPSTWWRPVPGRPSSCRCPAARGRRRWSARRSAWVDREAGFEVSARGFWQVHPGAAATFVDAVLEALAPQPGERALDLYAGVGLFAAALADAVGESGKVARR